ncbi:hypothetical protein PG985_001619 [Apiospora marii]|uniref:uncharacterized protein n=1 Tax=Apiospora marii TaxID=335849 RepID=UPI0031321634
MAILAELPGFQVVVRVDGKDATEYPSHDPQHRQATCPVSCVYIESVDDARFAVELLVDESYNFARDEEHHLRIRVEVDGALFVQQSDDVPNDPTTKFQKELGIIKVHVYRVSQRKPVDIWSDPTITNWPSIVAAARRGRTSLASNGMLEAALANIPPTPPPATAAVAQNVREPPGREDRQQPQLDARNGRRAPPRSRGDPGAMSSARGSIAGPFRIKKHVSRARTNTVDRTSN